MHETGFRRWLIVVVTVAVFVAVDHQPWWLFREFWFPNAEGLSRIAGIALLRYFVPWFLIPIATAALLFGPRRAFSALGLTGPFVKGWSIGFLGTSVMLAGYIFVADFAPPADLFEELALYTFLPGLFEEVLYRGLLFGFLFRYAGLGFLPSALLGAAFFGGGHLYQGGSPAEAATIFAFTASGAVWFAWLYSEWDFNLWVPVSFHILMNMYFTLFPVGEQAFVNGDMAGNVLRLATIVLSIILTLIFSRRGQGRRIPAKSWVWGGPRA